MGADRMKFEKLVKAAMTVDAVSAVRRSAYDAGLKPADMEAVLAACRLRTAQIPGVEKTMLVAALPSELRVLEKLKSAGGFRNRADAIRRAVMQQCQRDALSPELRNKLPAKYPELVRDMAAATPYMRRVYHRSRPKSDTVTAPVRVKFSLRFTGEEYAAVLSCQDKYKLPNPADAIRFAVRVQAVLVGAHKWGESWGDG